jgi:hypothetical protein
MAWGPHAPARVAVGALTGRFFRVIYRFYRSIQAQRARSARIWGSARRAEKIKLQKPKSRKTHGWLMTGQNALSCRPIPILVGQSCGFAQIWAAEHPAPYTHFERSPCSAVGATSL